MHVMPIKGFPHAKLGYMHKGQVYEVAEDEGKRLVKYGHVNPAAAPIYATKIVQQQPVAGELPGMADGAEQQSSASPAAPVSQRTTLSLSKRGGKRRKGGESSSPTLVSE